MILIGCPVFDRAWILPYWFQAIKQQTIDLSEIGFLFVVSSEDKETIDCLFKFQADNPNIAFFDLVYEDGIKHHSHREVDGQLVFRNWSRPDSLTRMVILRNTLLARVREIQPEFFFSLDSDILLQDPLSLHTLVDLLRSNYEIDALNTYTYMDETARYPSVMSWKFGGPLAPTYRGMPMAVRNKQEPDGNPIKSDVIMASKLMTPEVYNKVDYIFHPKGEDLGWSWNCRTEGFDLYCHSGVYTPHIMSRKMLELFLSFGDDRCGTIKTVKVV